MVLYSIAKWYIIIGLGVAGVFWTVGEIDSYLHKNDHDEDTDLYIKNRNEASAIVLIYTVLKSILIWPYMLYCFIYYIAKH